MRQLAIAAALLACTVGAPIALPATRAAPPCHAGDLTAQLYFQGATGSLLGGVRVTNRGGAACSLLGSPGARFAGKAAAGVRYRVLVNPPSLRIGGPRVAALQPGEQASALLQWRNWCRSGRPLLVVVLPHRGGQLRLHPHDTPRCDKPAAPVTLALTRFVLA